MITSSKEVKSKYERRMEELEDRILRGRKLKKRKKKKKKDAKPKVKNSKTDYSAQLRDEKWIRYRERVLGKYGRKCAICGSEERLQVHHLKYIQNRKAWEYPFRILMVLCADCHRKVHFVKPIDLDKHEAQVNKLEEMGQRIIYVSSVWVDFMYLFHPVRYYFLTEDFEGESISPGVGFEELISQLKF